MSTAFEDDMMGEAERICGPLPVGNVKQAFVEGARWARRWIEEHTPDPNQGELPLPPPLALPLNEYKVHGIVEGRWSGGRLRPGESHGGQQMKKDTPTFEPEPCAAFKQSDMVVCRKCTLSWDANDPDPPACPRGGR